ncbi:hypothetical protein Vretimale_7459, partial [Volvox reticuliferus]
RKQGEGILGWMDGQHTPRNTPADRYLTLLTRLVPSIALQQPSPLHSSPSPRTEAPSLTLMTPEFLICFRKILLICTGSLKNTVTLAIFLVAFHAYGQAPHLGGQLGFCWSISCRGMRGRNWSLKSGSLYQTRFLQYSSTVTRSARGGDGAVGRGAITNFQN